MPEKFRDDNYWFTSGSYSKKQLNKIARIIVENTEYDDYDISYSDSHMKKRAQIIFLKGPHLEFRCHHVEIKN